MPFGCFGFDEGLVYQFMTPHHPLPSYPIEVFVVLAMPVKKYQQWWAIQLAIHLIVLT